MRPRRNGTGQPLVRRTAYISILLMAKELGLVTGQLYSWETVEEACPNAFLYENPMCQNNGTLHIGSRGEGTNSCSYCDCPQDWGGLDCNRCFDVSVCPNKTVDGVVKPATNCSSHSLIPTAEESEQQELGKVFSCTCGGGGDSWSETLCSLQRDTAVVFTINGTGTDESPAFMTFALYAGTDTVYQESWEGEHTYFYPVVFAGSAENCKVTRGNCLAVDETDLGEQECVRFDCENTQGSCPPEGYEVCDGFPECFNENGQEYRVHSCLSSPAVGKSLTIACLDDQSNGTFICYYQQPGEFAPLSITCSVGSCLYEGTDVNAVDTYVLEESPLTMREQSAVLIGAAIILISFFFLFAVLTDWGSARRDSESCCFSKSSDESVYRSEASGVAISGVGDVAAGRGALPGGHWGNASTGLAQQPALLEWKDLSYAVELKQGRVGVGSTGWCPLNRSSGGKCPLNRNSCGKCPLSINSCGKCPLNLNSCRKPQLSVLSKVSGFAGPREDLSGGVMARASSFSSCLSALAAASDGGLRSSHPASDTKLLPSSAVGSTRTVEVEEPTAGPMSSTMTGILGPSGAGKSTLLDVLAGRKRAGDGCCVGHISLILNARSSDGERDACGGKIRVGPGEIRRLSGYVPQEEVLSGTLTCYEHLMFHARLRMPRGATHVERRARALSVLEELGLSRVADSRVGDAMKRGISGGEKRRLSIAAELMAQPPLLFLDEPTTGLDAAAALRVITLLKGVSSRGTTVMCSLHQPRPKVVGLLDNVMLMSGGRVAYFGTPGEAEAYFSSVGRPFPPGQPHPADAMLTLCCREDGCALPMLFERCGQVENGSFKGPIRGGMYVGSAFGSGNSGGVASVMSMQDRQSLRRDCPQPHYRADMISTSGVKSHQGVADFEAGDSGDRYGDAKVCDEEGCKYGWFGLGGRVGRGGVEVPQTAGFLVQTEALSRRLLLRAVRHPLLLALHFLGSLGMAVCLGTIFQGKMGFTFEGAQSRFGALFFILLYLSLLSLTSLPVWREDRRLFLTETMGGVYGHLGYFTSVALVDVLLIRVLPPLFFAVVAYPLMGLNSFSDGHFTLLWFTLIIVLVNVAVALAAMGVGALGLPLDLSNLLGGGMVLLFVLFSGFLFNGDRITSGLRWLTNVTPVGFAFESLLANEFNDPLGSRPYTIEADKCSPELPVIKPLGATILKTFEFDPDLETMRSNVGWLTLIALIFCVISFVIFYAFTRTNPLKVHKSEKGRRRIPSRPTSASFKDEALTAPTPHGTGEQASALVETPSESVSMAEQGEQHGQSNSKGREASTERVHPILLSWEDVGFSIPLRGGIGGYFGELLLGFIRGERGRRRCVPVLDEVSGFAGAPVADPVRSSASRGMYWAPPITSAGRSAAKETPVRVKVAVRASRGSITAIMGPSGAGKTSLLNVLAGRHREASNVSIYGGRCKGGVRVKGTVRVDGVEVGPAAVREMSGYVGQEDVLPETMTCFEYLMFHAELRLWNRAGEKRGCCSGRADRERRVLEVMRELHLKNIRDSRIGGGLVRGVSGGERRRLSIGVEMLKRPGLLFLDEPTTGQDSSTAMTIMQLLSGVASRGTTVVCTLHQPRPQAFELLDGVLLLSRGRVAFFGAPSAVADHFASVGCPLGVEGGGLVAGGVGLGLGLGHADAMLDVVAEAESAEEDMDGGSERGGVIMSRDVLVEKVREAEAQMALKPLNLEEGRAGEGQMFRRVSGSRTPPMHVQLRALAGRAMLNVTRDPYLAALHLVLLPLVGLLLGGLFGDLRRLNEETAGIQGRLGVLFFLLLFLSFLCLTSLASWVKQMTLFRHERNSGAYGAFAHLSTSFLADALVCRVVPPWLLAVTARPLLGLRYGSLRGLGGGLVVFNVSLAGVLAACGSRARSGQEALAMGCLVVLFSALLSGYLVARDDLPAFWAWLAWASPFAHGFEALAVNEFSEYGFVFMLTTTIAGYTETSDPLSGDNILSCFGYDKDRFDEDLIFLAVIAAIGLFLAHGLLNRA